MVVAAVCHLSGLGGRRCLEAGRRGRRPLRMVVVTACRSTGRGRWMMPGRWAIRESPLRWKLPPFTIHPARVVFAPGFGAPGRRALRMVIASVHHSPGLGGGPHSVFIPQEKRPGNPGRFFRYVTQRSLFAYLARALSAFAISSKMPACFLDTIALMTSRTQIMRAISMTRQMGQLLMKGAIRKPTALTHTTVMA